MLCPLNEKKKDMTTPKSLSFIINIREKMETDRNREMGEFRVNIPSQLSQAL